MIAELEKKHVQSEVECTKSCILAVEMDKSTEMKPLPKIDIAKIGTNPFLVQLVIPVTKIVSSDDLVENEEGAVVNKVLYQEQTQKIEIYYHECAGDNIANLSDKAQRLLLHILYTLKRNQDYYQLNKEHYMKRNKIRSMTTVSNAVNELIRYQYLVRSAQVGVYWINPYRFYPGSRISKYPNNIQIKGNTWDQTKGQKYEDKKKKKTHKFGEPQTTEI